MGWLPGVAKVGTMPSHMISRAVDSPHMMQPARYAFALDSNELVCKHKQAFNSIEKEYHAMETTLNGPFSQSARYTKGKLNLGVVRGKHRKTIS